MHMISKKDLNSAELETVTTSRSPTTVITTNGEVQANEEATVYVRELDMFLTMKVLGDTPAVLSLGKLCDEHGYSYEWINGQKPHLIKKGIWIQCNTENFVPIVVPGLSASSSSSSSTSTPTTLSPEIDHSDHPPAIVSSESVDRQVRGDPCRRCIYGAVLRARKFWWFDYSRSQSSQWWLWISNQSSICNRGARLGYPKAVQNQNFSGNKGACRSTWSQIGNQKSFYTDNSLEFGKACEDHSWNHCTSTPHRSQTN